MIAVLVYPVCVVIVMGLAKYPIACSAVFDTGEEGSTSMVMVKGAAIVVLANMAIALLAPDGVTVGSALTLIINFENDPGVAVKHGPVITVVGLFPDRITPPFEPPPPPTPDPYPPPQQPQPPPPCELPCDLGQSAKKSAMIAMTIAMQIPMMIPVLLFMVLFLEKN
jgi:hypothetical protein